MITVETGGCEVHDMVMDQYLVAATTAVPDSEAQAFQKLDYVGAAHGRTRSIKTLNRPAKKLSTHVTPPVVS